MSNNKPLKHCIIGFLLAAVLLAGCGKPPTEEMENALAALTRAENDPDAAIYAASSLRRARLSLERMYEEANSKRYDAAKTLAQEVIATSEKAITDSKTAAARARDETVLFVAAVKTEVEEARQALNTARRAGVKALNYNSLADSIANARQLVDGAELDLRNGVYRDAYTKAEEARSLAAMVRAALAQDVRAGTRKQ